MSEIRDKVEEEIRSIFVVAYGIGVDDETMKEILSIPELAIVDGEAELPKNPFQPARGDWGGKVKRLKDRLYDVIDKAVPIRCWDCGVDTRFDSVKIEAVVKHLIEAITEEFKK